MLDKIQPFLSSALKSNEIKLVYQPIFDCEQFVVGYEVLMRWDSSSLGEVSRTDFMTVFDDSELVSELNNYFFSCLISDLSEIGLLTVKKLFINLSCKQLEDDSLITNLDKLSKIININNIILEVTENTLMNDIDKVIHRMEMLTKHGLSFALDNFGTGFSSMKFFKILPIKYIKIDKSFIGELDINHEDRTIVKAILDMAKAIGFSVIAEGVENRSQFVMLKSLGIDLVQGYFFHRPELKEMLS